MTIRASNTVRLSSETLRSEWSLTRRLVFRHQCEQSDGMAGYGWEEYDVRTGGNQVIRDVGNQIDIQTQFVKVEGGENGACLLLYSTYSQRSYQISRWPLGCKNQGNPSWRRYVVRPACAGQAKQTRELQHRPTLRQR